MDMSHLAEMMLAWEKAQRRADELRTAIEDAVMQLEATQVVGNVRASYSGGRKSYNYRAVGEDAPDVLREEYTITKTNWRKLVLEGMKIDKETIPFTQSAPSVSVSLES